jgi:hypothetical protein
MGFSFVSVAFAAVIGDKTVLQKVTAYVNYQHDFSD